MVSAVLFCFSLTKAHGLGASPDAQGQSLGRVRGSDAGDAFIVYSSMCLPLQKVWSLCNNPGRKLNKLALLRLVLPFFLEDIY